MTVDSPPGPVTCNPGRRRPGTSRCRHHCSAALRLTPRSRAQFYCLAYSSTALTTVSRIPTWARGRGPTDPYGVPTVAVRAGAGAASATQLPECESSMEIPGTASSAEPVPDDGFGDAYLVIDNRRKRGADRAGERDHQPGPVRGGHWADRESERRTPVRAARLRIPRWRRLRTPSWCVDLP